MTVLSTSGDRKPCLAYVQGFDGVDAANDKASGGLNSRGMAMNCDRYEVIVVLAGAVDVRQRSSVWDKRANAMVKESWTVRRGLVWFAGKLNGNGDG